MSLEQLKRLQELSQVFSQGKANPKQIQQLSALLAQINRYDEAAYSEDVTYIPEPRLG